MELFEYQATKATASSQPLAERMRPVSIDDFIGQHHVVGKETLLHQAIVNDRLFSMLLWGPPGCGKTTLAGIIARETKSHFIQISAVLSGVKQIRTVIETAKDQLRLHHRKTILFVDEIHRFNKAQQDAFLHHVEKGLITLIGATTENPSFEVIAPLLSRCRVITFNPLGDDDIRSILQAALTDQIKGCGRLNVSLTADAIDHLVRIGDGDARTTLNNLEIAVELACGAARNHGDEHPEISIHLEDVEQALQQKALSYDKSGDTHYNIISAFIKSLRGSDPDAAIYWLARMLESGEDPLYVARRMVRFATEDIGLADPFALGIAVNATDAVRFIGLPEGELALVQAAVYLSTASKSNSLYSAFKKVKDIVKKTGSLAVPFHIRNAPTRLMDDLGYGKGYKYAHDSPDGFVAQTHLPEDLVGKEFYQPKSIGYEKNIKQRVETWRSLRRKADHS
ncbi:MAG: replication-associated recombination protein A [Desulfobacteraceae bacterium]|nr:replication-associated recombination protein A [Desulfobacteraceae bacterium]